MVAGWPANCVHVAGYVHAAGGIMRVFACCTRVERDVGCWRWLGSMGGATYGKKKRGVACCRLAGSFSRGTLECCRWMNAVGSPL